MNRNPIYATADYSLSRNLQPHQDQVIRPPLREAYDSQKNYDHAVRMGISYAQQNNIPYIDNYNY